ncbi:MAG: hypothetical protein IT483_09350 [Gammaproteobacteria bacterium]|nr:hypothetical protein [Gammaproteobacteria bacterium]
MHDRIAGVPPSDATLALMQADIAAGRLREAADRAMQDPAFYGVTIKNLATPWTNRERTVFAPLNDYTATVIGMVRDDVPFDELLSGDILYVGRSGLGLPAASASGNDHYAEMERRRLDLADALVRSTQSTAYGLPVAATAGVMTTRAASQAFFVAGTNRAMFRFTVVNHLCSDLEQLQDTTRPPDRIRQDVSRSPGGDSRLFLNNCIGCHAGMDPMAQAFAYYNYDEAQGRLVYSAPAVQPKYSINADSFRPGYVTRNDRWDNYWRQGQNALLGWDAGLPGAGNGAKSLGQELAGTRAFASCQVEKVFKAMCLRSPDSSVDRARVATVTSAFRSGGYRLKQVVADVATYCMGE